MKNFIFGLLTGILAAFTVMVPIGMKGVPEAWKAMLDACNRD